MTDKTESGQIAKEKTSSPPLVSVIVPTRNRRDQLCLAVKSILAQSYPNFEIIVVNDAGIDVTDQIAALNTDKTIVLLTHPESKGAPAARNTGLRIAKGDYIAYLDDDDLFYPDHLETLVSFLESSDLQVAYTDASRAYHVWEDGGYSVQKREIPFSIDFDADCLLVFNIASVNCFMHSKACLEEVGLFDETMAPLEDWDYWIRLSQKYTFGHIKKVTCEVSWRVDGTSLTSSRRADFIIKTRTIYEKYRKLTENKPTIVESQKKTLLFSEKHLADELRIQQLLERMSSICNRDDPVVREFLSLTLTAIQKGQDAEITTVIQDRKIRELEQIVERFRNNVFFKVYHWVKYLGRE